METLVNSDHFIVLCEAYRNKMISRYHIENDDLKRKIMAIPNPYALVDYHRTEKDNIILFVGRLTYWDKRCDRFLRIWNTVEKLCPEWTCLILGDGEERQALEALSKRLKLRHLKFLGYQDPKPYYKKASVLCLTSSSEGLPMTILEAASYEIPTIAFNINEGIRFLIDDGKTGCLIPPFDERLYAHSLANLICNPHKVEKLGKNAKANLKKFDIESIGKRWIDLLS